MQFINAKGNVVVVSYGSTPISVRPQQMISLPEEIGLAHNLSPLDDPSTPKPRPKEPAAPLPPTPPKPRPPRFAPPPPTPGIQPMPLGGIVQQQPVIVPVPFEKTETPKEPITAKPALPPGQAAGVETNTPEQVLDKVEEAGTDTEKVAEMLEATGAPPVTIEEKAPDKKKTPSKKKKASSRRKKAPAKGKG